MITRRIKAKEKSIKKNFIMNAILTMSSFVFPLIAFPYVARVIGPSGTGKVSFAISIVSYFTLFSNLGIPTYGIRACAKVRDDKEKLSRVVHELLMINIVTMIISYCALFIFILIIPKLQELRTLLLLISITIFLTAIGMEWLYRGLEEYTYITIRSIIFKIIAVFAMFLLIHSEEDYLWYGLTSIMASSASNVFNLFHARKYILFHSVGNYHPTKHLKSVLIFFSMSIATTIYTNLDTIMLGLMKNDIDVGYYDAAIKIKKITVSIVTSLGTVLLPRASYYVECKEYIKFKEISSKAINFVFLISIPMLIYFILFAKEGIYFLSGSNYKGAIIPMQIIMPTLLFIGLSNVLGIQILLPLGKEKVVLYSEVFGAIVDFSLNLLLIPRYASSGAAIGTLLAEFVVLIYQYWYLRKEVSCAFGQVNYKRIFLALLSAFISIIWMKAIYIGNAMTLILSSILFWGVYGIVLLIFKEPLVIEVFQQIKKKVINLKS